VLNHVTDLIQGSWRYATGLRSFLAVTIDLEEATAILLRQFQNRDETFLRVLERGIYGNQKSPYRRILLHAGFQFDDVRRLVLDLGLEAALAHLYDNGVYVTLDEFKGRSPVRRNGLEFAVSAMDFDNPLLTAHYQGRTGGSRGGGTRVDVDLDYIAHDAASLLCHLHANGVEDRPIVFWTPAHPPMQGLGTALRLARIGRMPTKWFSPNKAAMNRQGFQSRALLAYSVLASRMLGRPIPGPQYLADLSSMVEYLGSMVGEGTPPVMVCAQSRVIRICLAAEETGIDISGTVFYTGGEPYTEGKAAIVERVGAVCIPAYAMQDGGFISYRCGTPLQPDDMHVMTERLVVLQRPMQRAPGLEVQGLFHTSLLTSAPKLMLNVESGDYGVMEERDCGCLWQELGFITHLHTIRSYEKLTSEGVMFMGSMLHEVLEETLPSRFGGGPLDYQLVEQESGGVARVSIVISPRIGPIDEEAVVDTVLKSLSFADWSRRQADLWRQNGTLGVQRREPYATGAAKILPLHLISASPEKSAPPPESKRQAR
jgi:hypothetical protein